MNEERKQFRTGNIIEFQKIEKPEDVLVVKILELYPCKSFRELYSMFPAGDFGHEGESVDSLVENIRDIYSEERENRDGVLGIRVEVINDFVGGKMERVYNKLVRDRIPEIIKNDGNEPVIRIMEKAEYKQSLFKKLHEEINEFTEDESIEELCDVLEVIDALKTVLGYSDESISEIKSKKQAANGAFNDRIFLEKVIVKDK